MDNIKLLLPFLFAAGFSLVVLGSILRVYPQRLKILDLKKRFTLEEVANHKYLASVLDFLLGRKSTRRYRFTQKMITRSETEVSVRALLLLKIISLLSITSITLLISFTNVDVMKFSIISKPQDGLNIFQDTGVQDYARNAALYKAVVNRIGEDALKRLDRKQQLAEIKKTLHALMGTGEREVIEEKAAGILKAFETVSKLHPLNFTVVLIILSSFW